MALFPGNLLVGAPTIINGAGPGAGAGSALTAQTNFRNAIGGANNTTASGPQTGGFRTIDWDAVQLNGNDFGGGPNTTVITLNETVGIPLNRFQARGVHFEEVNAVSDNGFNDVNPNVAGRFPAFSPNNTFSSFNDNTIEVSFTLASAATNTPVPAATRGFGAIFINVRAPNTSFIEYFSGGTSLRRVPVPVGANQGEPQFAGALFSDAVVTRVVLTLGTGVLFTFNGTTTTGTTTDTPTATPPSNLVVTDDFSYAEPVPLSSTPPVLSGPQGTLNAQPTVDATFGTAFSGVVATFSDSEANIGIRNYTAVINWGDGQFSNGTIVASGSGFNVVGTNTFRTAGLVPISVDVQKLDAAGTEISLTNTARVATANTTTTLAVDPVSSLSGQPVTLTATIAPSTGVIPTGQVTFRDGETVLGVVNVDNMGRATLVTSRLTSGDHSLSATFSGDRNFNTSTSTATNVTVRSEVTSQVRFALGRIRRRGNRFTQHVDITNIGDTLAGPLAYVLGGLPGNVRLLNSSGVSRVQVPGSPFILLDLGPANQLAANATIGIDLSFSARSSRAIRYTSRLFAGPGPV